ncbi:YbaB/EbfC family nucleoid-associated protein [Actinophytocola sp. NPDC049390]|uniref:YbaB/EbfC family nucleoid-associated protein n=1 Tax=Actinophytocola sp. NPDC049390 TaxID=3363894 RepID=UPI0037BBF503
MRELDDAIEVATRRAEVFGEANRRIDAITVTQCSPDGAVEVTVGASGNVLNVRCTERVRTIPPHQLAAVIQQCVQAAQAGLAGRIEETLRSAAPDDPLTDELVANAHKAFPPPLPVPVQAAGGPAGPRHMDIGGIVDDDPRPRRMTPRRPRPPSRDEDPDDWGGRSFMS